MENQQIGWSTESKLLYKISKLLEQTAGLVAASGATVPPAVMQAIEDAVVAALSDDFAGSNPTTTPLTLAMLDSGYPNAPTGFRVICMSISAGALIYTKTALGWAKQSVTNVT